MAMIFKFLLCLCFLAVAHGRSIEEIRRWFVDIALECSKEHTVTTEELMQLHKHIIPDTPNVKCLLACVYRKSNFLDDKGMFDLLSATSMIEKEHMEDEDKKEKSKKLFDICKIVNEASVSDGEKGCDRSAMLTNCLIKNAPKVGINEFLVT